MSPHRAFPQRCFESKPCCVGSCCQDPQLLDLVPDKGPVSGGTRLTIRGRRLLTGQKSDLSAFLGPQPCYMYVLYVTSDCLCVKRHESLVS